MEFEKSSLYLEVKSIINAGATPVHYTWSAQLHANNLTIDAMKVASIDNMMDFELNCFDEIVLMVVLPLGTYAKKIYPYRNNLEVTLIRKPVTEVGNTVDENREINSERFIAILMEQKNPDIDNDSSSMSNEDLLNISNVVMVKMQLINKTVDQMRMRAVGGVYRKITPGDAIKAILTRESALLELDKELLPLGVDMIPPDNTKARNHILIPHGKILTTVPQFIQDSCGGVYSTGLGFYFHNQLNYIFPIYNTERFDEPVETLTIINAPGKKLIGLERSYRKTGSNLTIVATGDISFQDISDSQQLTLGNGTRFADANSFIDGFVYTKDNKAIARRGNTLTEGVSVKRESGNNLVRMSERPINANPYREFSDLARRDGSILNMVWENADPKLLHPAMPVKILYLNDGEIREIRGVLLKAHANTFTRAQVMFAPKLITNVGLCLFINRKAIVT